MEYKFSEAITINPRESLKKGTVAKKVSMSDIRENTRSIFSFEYAPFSGGTKFRNGDTLFARITPSLENGKIAQVNILSEKELGFGSTEFLVFRAVEGITIPDYVYHLSRWDYLKETAIKSMTGTSGRQRVQNSIFDTLIIDIPEIEVQENISKILNSFDQKIEVNKKIIANLEAQAQAIFKSWFVDFEPFQDGNFVESELGLIPEGWEVTTTGLEFNIEYGKQLPTKHLLPEGYPVFGGNGQIGYYNEFLYEKPKLIVSCRGAASGKTGVTLPYSFVTNNSLIFDEKDSQYFYYYKCLFDLLPFNNYVTGSAQPQLTITNSKNIKLLKPSTDEVVRFNRIAKPFFENNLLLNNENQTLAELRDTLLPKLMSGEIDLQVDEEEEIKE